MRAATLDRLMIAPRFRWLIRRTASRVQKKVPSRCTASIRRHDSSERFWVTSRWVCAPSPFTISMTRASALRPIPARSSPGPRAMPALFTRISSAPSSRSMVANIALTWALSATSAWIARPPADPFISDTVFSATSRRTSLTTTCAPSSAKSSAIARPSPDPPPVTSATRSVSFIGRALRSLFVLPVPAHRPHPRPKGERNQGGRDAEILGLHPADACILGVDAQAKAVDEFIDTITPSYALGIDIGGTFTDIVVYDHDSGRQWSRKVLTTHDDPVRAVAAGVATVLGDGRLESRHFTRVVHATTLFTNALIERKGAVTGLITTAGFGDTLEIGRERKFELYDLNIAKPEPLVPRNLRLEVAERVKADGSVRQPLDRAQLLGCVDRLVAGGVGSIAVVFLHAYANPRHEAEAVGLIAERYPEIYTTASHEVAPEIREFERASTTVANAYIKPLAHQYLGRMARQLAEARIPAPLLLMLSSGGLTHVAEAQRTPVQMLESGPAAGAIAAAFFGRADSGGDLLAFDMGGTTAKLSLVDGGEPRTAYSFEAARQKRFIEGSGLPIRISTIELIEIGAGGGSIAHVDEIGLLKVGPRSAGSQPGPACYGLGGSEPTVTDADLLLGYLNPEYFAGGTIAIDLAAARAALTGLADAVRLPLISVAWGVHDVVNENMATAARVHIAERGRDPRDYALLCTGGAGPVHACHVACKLGLRQVICPPWPAWTG